MPSHNGAVAVCVVGCGHWGKNLVRSFHRLGSLYAVCESDPAARAAMAGLYPAVKLFSALEDALADPLVGAIVLATPANNHHQMGLAALRAGKDLFVEKPLALSWQSGMELVQEANARKLILMVGHLLRYHPAVEALQSLIAADTLGEIEYAYSNRLSMGKIRREENALWSFAPHDISVLLALIAQVPLQVMATGGAYVQPNIADVTVSHLLFEHGTRAHIFVSWLHPYKEQRLVIIGSRKMAVFEDTAPTNKLLIFDKQIALKDGVFQATKPTGTAVEFDATEPLLLECGHFLECVQERRKPLTPGEEGVVVLQVLQACHRSLQMNGHPIAVHESRMAMETAL